MLREKKFYPEDKGQKTLATQTPDSLNKKEEIFPIPLSLEELTTSDQFYLFDSKQEL